MAIERTENTLYLSGLTVGNKSYEVAIKLDGVDTPKEIFESRLQAIRSLAIEILQKHDLTRDPITLNATRNEATAELPKAQGIWNNLFPKDALAEAGVRVQIPVRKVPVIAPPAPEKAPEKAPLPEPKVETPPPEKVEEEPLATDVKEKLEMIYKARGLDGLVQYYFPQFATLEAFKKNPNAVDEQILKQLRKAVSEFAGSKVADSFI
jgi:hypothetical protein